MALNNDRNLDENALEIKVHCFAGKWNQFDFVLIQKRRLHVQAEIIHVTPRTRENHGGGGSVVQDRDVVPREPVETSVHGARVPNFGSSIQVFRENSAANFDGGLQGPFPSRADSIPDTIEVRLKLFNRKYHKMTGTCVPPIERHT